MADANPGNTGEELRKAYTNEEISELIRVALNGADRSDQSAVSQEEMLTIAGEFGLNKADLVRASETLAASRAASEKKKSRASRAMDGFKINFVCYVAGVFGIFLINAFLSPEFWWFVLAAIAYGMVILVHGFFAFFYPDRVLELLHDEEIDPAGELQEASR